MTGKPRADFIEDCRRLLKEVWSGIQPTDAERCPRTGLPKAILEAVDAVTNSNTKTYRYVLPTQLLAKCVDPKLDCRAIQATSGMRGAFDARSLCHKVVVEFDRDNSNVLGGSQEPYLNNPLRIPSITARYRHAQKDKKSFDLLRKLLDFAEQNPGLARVLLCEVLSAIRRRLSMTSVAYPVPNRTSLSQTAHVVKTFLDVRSGGLRLQAVAATLFRCIGARFGLFAQVKVNSVNAADAATGNAADLECLDSNGSIVIAVEVKDRSLTLRHAEAIVPTAREKGIREVLFLVQGGLEESDEDNVNILIKQEFGTGQNLYVCDFEPFIETCFVLFGEGGRREFLQKVGAELDSQLADIRHRQAWAFLLQGL